MAEFYKVVYDNKRGGRSETTVIGSEAQTHRFALSEARSYGCECKIQPLGLQLPDGFKGTVLNLTNS